VLGEPDLRAAGVAALEEMCVVHAACPKSELVAICDPAVLAPVEVSFRDLSGELIPVNPTSTPA
jgi:hypothetical protein